MQNDSDLGGIEPDPRLQLTKIANPSEDFEKKVRFCYLINLWLALLSIFVLLVYPCVFNSCFCTNIGSIMSRVGILIKMEVISSVFALHFSYYLHESVLLGFQLDDRV